MSERWLTFDCYGTLVDWNGGFRGALKELAGDKVDDLVGSYHRWEPIIQTGTPHCSYRDVLALTLERAAAECGIPMNEGQETLLSESWEGLRPFEDVEDILAGLRQSGFRLGILTNCDDDLFAVTHAQFAKPFDLVITAEQVMDYKPSLSHFRRFQRVTGVGSGHWIHVACSWRHDMVPAAALGLPRVWLDRDETGDDPALASIRITDPADLAGSVARLSQSGSAGTGSA